MASATVGDFQPVKKRQQLAYSMQMKVACVKRNNGTEVKDLMLLAEHKVNQRSSGGKEFTSLTLLPLSSCVCRSESSTDSL